MKVLVLYSVLNDLERKIVQKIISLVLDIDPVFEKLTDGYQPDLTKNDVIILIGPDNEKSVFWKRVKNIGIDADLVLKKDEGWLKDKEQRRKIIAQVQKLKEKTGQKEISQRTILKKYFPSINDKQIDQYLGQNRTFVITTRDKHWTIVPEGCAAGKKDCLTFSELLTLFFASKVFPFKKVEIIDGQQ